MKNRYSVKSIVILSMVTLLTAVMAKLFVLPTLLQEAPRMYSSMLTWLTPPYLYFLVNCIIITIAATSHFQTDGSDHFKTTLVGGEVDPPPPLQMPGEVNVLHEQDKMAPEEYGLSEPFEEVGQVKENVKNESREKGEINEEMPLLLEEEEEDFVISRSDWTPPSRTSSGEFSYEKPPVSSRFVSRRALKASPEGKLLGVSRAKRNETLESTWKMITDGRAIPLTRHLKKSDTWGNTTTQREKTEQETSPMKKSETFNDKSSSRRRKTSTVTAAAASPGSSSSGGGGGRLRREASPSQDELYKRVEAFIKKFNQEMRLQGQQSQKHYSDMLNNNRTTVRIATKQ